MADDRFKKMRYHVIVQIPYMSPQVVAGTSDVETAHTLFAIKADKFGNQHVWLRDTKVGVHDPILALSAPLS